MIRGGITVFCSDLARSREFYGLRLGMTVTEDEDGFWATRGELALRVEGGAKARRLSRDHFEEAGVLVRVETDEFDTLVTSIRERGVSLFGEIKETDEGRFTGFCDPDGNLFEVVEIVQSAG